MDVKIKVLEPFVRRKGTQEVNRCIQRDLKIRKEDANKYRKGGD